MKEREEVQRRERLRMSSQSSHNDDENNFGTRLWEKAKGFATKKKSVVTQARYSRTEDKLELLTEDNGTELRPTRNTYRPRPDTGLFDDI